MKTLRDWKKGPEGPISIAIPSKGELAKPAMEWLSNYGIQVEDSRSYCQVFGDLIVFRARTVDIPFYLVSGLVDFGITGEDNIQESGFEIEVKAKLGFGQCQVCLAAPEIVELAWFNGRTIATSTPKIVSKFLSENGIEAEIKVVNGADEGAVKIGLASAVGILKSSGETLEANNLQVIKTILESEAVLVQKPKKPQKTPEPEGKPILEELADTISDRRKNPTKASYVSKIVNEKEAIAAKIREEAKELIEAQKPEDIIWEAADLLFFMLVYLENRDIKFSQVLDELKRRRK